jgi:hypothetical protein
LGYFLKLEPPLAVTCAWREAAAVSHLGAVPHRMLRRVRTPSIPASIARKHRVTVPRRAQERSSGEPPMAPRWALAPPSSAGFAMSRPLKDGGPGSDHRYPFILIISKLPKLKSTAKIDLLCRRLMNQNHGPGPWDRGPIPLDFQ